MKLSAPAVAVAVAVAAAGCGSSSKSSTSASSAASSTPASSSSTSPSPRPLTKAQYEQKLGPLLNNVVDPALRATVGTGAGAADPQKVGAAITSVQLAHDQMAAVTPPPQVADLNQRAVVLMASMITAMTNLRDAETRNDRNAVLTAATALKGEAQRLESLGSQFTARGY